jgi:hypothetical protein
MTTLVVGGGLFGCWAALTLAESGTDVVLLEQGPDILLSASAVNQARLHTGPHYPRSLLTAQRAYSAYGRFRAEFPEAVRDFTHIYGVASHSSKVDVAGFEAHLSRINLDAEAINVERWFHPESVSGAWKIEEPSFDVEVLRESLRTRLIESPRVSLKLNTPVSDLRVHSAGVTVDVDGYSIEAEEIVLAAYAGINPLRAALGIEPLPLKFELAEVILGKVNPKIRNVGFTVMDGPFWSMMPFGHGELSSLTSVGMTPVVTAVGMPEFPCQAHRADCVPIAIQDCSTCAVRPKTLVRHHLQQMSRYLAVDEPFTFVKSLMTVKAVLQTTEVDDARPTLVNRESRIPVTTVFSGKVTSIFELTEALS